MTKDLLLYTTTVLVWGSTWLAITYQLGEVDPLVSVVYRFALAAALLLVYCLLTGKSLKLPFRVHVFVFVQGACLFGLNYWLFYLTTQHLTSGLVAVTFSTVIFMNMLNGRLFLGRPIRFHVALAGAIGLVGIVLVFWPELTDRSLRSEVVTALVMAVVATYLASVGNIVSARNQSQNLPVLQTNAIGMAYGTLLMLGIALASGRSFSFEWTMPYVASLLFLAVFGSIVAFGCYLTLVGRLGADKAAYAGLLFPVVALQLSVWFEGYQWTGQSLLGMSLILIGNFIALAPDKYLRRRRREAARDAGRAAPCAANPVDS